MFISLDLVLIQATCLLSSMLILVSSAPFENEIRSRKEEKHHFIPPMMPVYPQLKERESLKAEENGFTVEKDNREVEARELTEKKFPEKMEREISEEKAEEFFTGLERELARRESRGEKESENTEGRWYDEEVHGREVPEGREELPEEGEEEDVRNLSEDEERETFERELEKELEERLVREMVEEESKRELEEEMELLWPEGMYVRELPEESEEMPNRELKTELLEDDEVNDKRETPEEERELPEERQEMANREIKAGLEEEEHGHTREPSEEGDEKYGEDEGENFQKSRKNVLEEHEEEEPGLNRKREEEERIAAQREMNFRRMFEDSGEEFPEWNEKFEDNRAQRTEEHSKRAKEFPKHMREQEAEREQERFDYHGNEERAREEFRERQRQRALTNGIKVDEREMEGRKQHEKIGSHGIRREERERFRFRARGE